MKGKVMIAFKFYGTKACINMRQENNIHYHRTRQ